MDPFVTAVTQFGWVLPAAAAAGAAGWWAWRSQRAQAERRIGVDAARLDLHTARAAAAAAAVTLRATRAERAHLKAKLATGRADAADVEAARRAVARAEKHRRAARADVAARRAQVKAAQAAMPRDSSDPSALPLARLVSAHDAVTARWLAYETDPARQLTFPAMSDAREPATAAFLTARAAAEAARPGSPRDRMTPRAFAGYRDAVQRLEATFDAAERRAWDLARAAGMVPADPADPAGATWGDTVQSAMESSARALAHGADGVRRVSHALAQAWRARGSSTPPDAGAR